MRQQRLQIEHLDRKLAPFVAAGGILVPDRGWIHAIRTSIRMSLRQLGTRMGISKQAVKTLEDREASRSVTLQSMIDVADALDMEFIYGFVPRKGSLTGMVDDRAEQVARTIVERTSATMGLENQGVNSDRLESAIRERTEYLGTELPRFLWD